LPLSQKNENQKKKYRRAILENQNQPGNKKTKTKSKKGEEMEKQKAKSINQTVREFSRLAEELRQNAEPEIQKLGTKLAELTIAKTLNFPGDLPEQRREKKKELLTIEQRLRFFRAIQTAADYAAELINKTYRGA